MFNYLDTLKDTAILHFSHNDSDGYGPSIISRFSSVNTLNFIPCSYGNFETKLTEQLEIYDTYQVLSGHGIVITDIAPKSEEVLKHIDSLYRKGLTVVLLDHHDTNRFVADLYPEWAFIESELDGKKTCGTELYHLYLKEKDLYPESVKNSAYLNSFVELIRSYDTWDWAATGNLAAKNLNNLLYVFGPKRYMEIQGDKILENYDNPGVTEYSFTEMEQTLIDIDNKSEAKYIKGRAEKLQARPWKVAGKVYNAGVVFADQFHSVLGNELHKMNPELDLIALYDMNGGKVSLRTIHDHVHVGEIAKGIHPAGGGHQKAAGFQFDSHESFAKMERLLKVDSPNFIQSLIRRFLDK